MHAQVVEGAWQGREEYVKESYTACDEEQVLGWIWSGKRETRAEYEGRFGVIHARTVWDMLVDTSISVAGMALQIGICKLALVK